MKKNFKKSTWVVFVPASLLVLALLILPQIKGNKGEEVTKINTSEVIAVSATSEREVQDLLIKGYIAEATNWLKLTRERSQKYDMDSHVGYIRKYVEKAGITVEDIGTTEEEIASLLKTGYISEATLKFYSKA